MLTLEDYGKGFSVTAIGLGLFMVFATMIKTTPKAEVLTEDQTYSMVRPTDYSGDFDLSGRDVDRTVIGGKKNKLGATQANAANTAAKPATAAKKTDDKKKQANSKKQTGSLKLANVNTRGDEGTLNLRNLDTRQEVPVVAAPAVDTAPPAKAESADNQNENPANVKSTNQWRAELHSHPTKALADDLLEARARGRLDAASFYQIALELFSDTATDRHNIGLYILQKDQSQLAFGYIAKAYTKVNETLQKDLWSILLTFSNANKFPGLATAMNSSDGQVVKLATDVLNVAINNIAATSQGSRDGRGVAGQSSVAAFQIFIPILTRLSSSTDQGIVQIARQLLARIGSFLVA
jgi:hypothetical protein